MISHPGPHTSRGRGVPELDVIEALINVGTGVGEVSQTMQIAPYDPDYIWTNTSATYSMTDTWETALNEYHGGVYQQVRQQAVCIGKPSHSVALSPALRCRIQISVPTTTSTGILLKRTE